MLRNPVSGARINSFLYFILNKLFYKSHQRYIRYNADGSVASTTDGSDDDRYSPILCLRNDHTLFSTYPILGRLIRTGTTTISEEIKFYAISNTFCDNIHLCWFNTTGGVSEYTFSYNIQKEMVVEKEYYKDSNKKDRLIPNSVITRNVIKAYTPIAVTELQLDYIKEILYSPLVYWQRAADDLVRVTVKSDAIITKNDNELTPFQIEIEW